MGFASHKNKIFKAIINTNAINMVYNFIGSDRPADVFRHNINVFSHIAPFVSVRVVRHPKEINVFRNVLILAIVPISIKRAFDLMAPHVTFGIIAIKISAFYHSAATTATLPWRRMFLSALALAFGRTVDTARPFTKKTFVTPFTSIFKRVSSLVKTFIRAICPVPFSMGERLVTSFANMTKHKRLLVCM